jgi:hypothetical protein
MTGNSTEFASALSFDALQIILNLVAATALGLITAWVYRRTHHGLSYSQGFVVSLVFVTVIGCGAMMVIGSNIARAFGLVGALSVIRYRTVVKDTRDASFIFLSLVAGFACGTASFMIGALTVGVVLGLALIVQRYRFGILREHDFILTFATPRREDSSVPAYREVLARNCERQTLLHIEPAEEDGHLLLTFDISLKEGVDSTELAAALSGLRDVLSPRMTFAKTDPNV